jgi:signal transduction histidine kinase
VRLLRAMRQQDWLALMLLALHAALVFGIDTPVSKAFLLSHFGFFLLWQPVWRGEQKLYAGQALLIVGAATLLVAAQSWWLMALWLCVLFALIGGDVPGIKNVSRRVVSMLAAAYLLSILLVWVVPHLFGGTDWSPLFLLMVRYGPLPALAAILLIKTERAPRSANYAVDLVYSLLLFLMVVVLVLGAFVIHDRTQGNYVTALAQALLVIAGILFALSWLWDPRGGFAGIGQLMNRYLLSVGMPFERWMHRLANLADHERDPGQFVLLAAREMATLPWVSGVDWRTEHDHGLAGERTRHGTQCRFGTLTLTLYTRWSPTPALVLHIKLLARLLADYYEAKTREQEQRRTVYLHAIYETGSRLTHDVKNLLQSLGSICSAVERSSEADAVALRRLVQRQLPQVTKRLQATLDKLNRRAEVGLETVPAAKWWGDLTQRYAHEGLRFEAGGLPAEATVPSELFDRVAENLLQNALEKRRAAPSVRVSARFAFDDGKPSLIVSDTGDALPETIARSLFNSPVASTQGLGVGLYQAARHAAASGYRLRLAVNRPGEVCFALEMTSAESLTEASPQPPSGYPVR